MKRRAVKVIEQTTVESIQTNTRIVQDGNCNGCFTDFCRSGVDSNFSQRYPIAAKAGFSTLVRH